MGKTKTPVGSIFRDKDGMTAGATPAGSTYGGDNSETDPNDDAYARRQFLLADDYKPPTGVKKLLLHRVGDWPVYSLLLAFVRRIPYQLHLTSILTGFRDKFLLPILTRSPSSLDRLVNKQPSFTRLQAYISSRLSCGGKSIQQRPPVSYIS